MTEQMQQSFDAWRALQPEGEPTLRQENAYRDGFADALKAMHAYSPLVLAGDEMNQRPVKRRKTKGAVAV